MADLGISDVSDVSEAELSDGDVKPTTKLHQPPPVKPTLGAKALVDSELDSTDGDFSHRQHPRTRAPPLSARVSGCF